MYKTLIIATTTIAITLSVLLGIIPTQALFHDNKPPKPEILSTNPEILAIFDEFYNKYPDITQTDVNQLHSDLTFSCASSMSESNEESNAIADMMSTAFCKGFTSGMIEDYLDGLGLAYFSYDNGETPTLTSPTQ